MMNFLIAFLISALAGIGVGGGGLLVLYLTLICGEEQLIAQGINIAFFMASAIFAMIFHFRKRHLNFTVICFVGILGAVGSVFGALLAKHLDSTLIQKAFGILLAASGVKTLFSRAKKSM